MKRMFLVFMLLILVGAGRRRHVVRDVGTGGPTCGHAAISGKVKDVKGAGVKGATVTVAGQSVKATTASSGSFKLSRRESRLGVPLCENTFQGVSGW